MSNKCSYKKPFAQYKDMTIAQTGAKNASVEVGCTSQCILEMAVTPT